MTTIQEAFETHAVRDVLAKCQASIADIDAGPGAALSGEAEDQFNVVKDVVGSVADRLSVASASLTRPSVLEQLQNYLSQLHDRLAAFAESNDAAEIAAAYSSTDPVLAAAVGFHVDSDSEGVQISKALRDDISAAATDAARRINTASGAIDEKIKQNQAQLDEVVEHLDTVRTKTIADIEDVSQGAVRRMEATDAKVEDQVKAFTATTTRLEERRSDAMKQIESRLDGQAADFAKAQEDRAKQFEAAMSSADERTEHLILLLTERQKEAEKLLGLASGAALSKRWDDASRAHRRERIWWILATFGLFMVSIVGAALFQDDLTATPSFSLTQAVIFYVPRIPIAIITITVIGFAVSQAARRSHWEARDQRVANELAALPTFLDQRAGTDDPQQKTLIQSVAEKYFPGTTILNDVTPDDQAESRQQGRGGFAMPTGAMVANLIANAGGLAALIVLLSQ